MAYESKKADKSEDVFETALTCFEKATSADNLNRGYALDDIRFALLPGNQWDPALKQLRGQRPCYEFNKIRQHIRQVTGDQRQNRPSIKVRASEDSDKKLADILSGLIRNIESVSGADKAYDTAFEFAVTGGFGCWRIVSEYSDDTSFEQDIKIREIRNPFAVIFDPMAQEWDCRDAMYAFLSEFVSKEEFKERYPKQDPADFETALGTRGSMWINENGVRIAEYWCKKPVTKTIQLLSDNRVVDAEKIAEIADELQAAGITVVKEREVETHEVRMYMVSGAGILSGPHEWAGMYIPLVPVWGDRLNLEGREYYSGMVRFAKDAQRTYNFERTTMMETVANIPKAPFFVTTKMVEGLQDIWDGIQSKLLPYLPFNPDPAMPGGPRREPGPEPPAALISLAAQSNDDIKSATGKYDASLGARSNETSGKAIMARQREGDVATFGYVDNLGRALKYTGEILVDLIPKIYDTRRTVRVLGEDGSQDYAVLNETVLDRQTGQEVILNDLSQAKFDVAVTVGPSYTTQRMETAEAMLQLANGNTPDAVIARYLALKSLDIPGSDEMLAAMRKMLVAQGVLEPKEGEPAPEPPQPDPEKIAKATKLAAEAEGVEIDNAKKQADLRESDLEYDMKEAELIGKKLENLIKAGQLGIAPDGRLMMMPTGGSTGL